MGLFEKLLGGGDKGQADVAFRKIYTLMTDEATLNRLYPPQLQQLMATGGAVDEIVGAVGDFGRDPGNPVPVNGPIGELVYISNLTFPGGTEVIGHRLGSANKIDVYEVMALDGSQWDLLFFDPYHTRKSRRLPTGYKTNASTERFLLATNQTVPSFPVGIYEAMRECTARILGISLVAPRLRDEALFCGFSRPPSHLSAVQALRLEARAEKGRACTTG